MVVGLRKVILALVACAAFVGTVSVDPIVPAQASSSSYTWNGIVDGLPTWVTIVHSGQVVHELTGSKAPWWRLGNTTSDAYLFAFGTPSNVVLGLQFMMRTKSQPEVLVYEVDGGQQPLQYEFHGDTLRILSYSGYPYMTMFPTHGSWLLPSGKPNFNLTLLIQGASGVGYPSVVRDGATRAVLEVGMGKRGAPEWQTLRPVPYPPSEYGYTRFSGLVRMAGAPPYVLPAPIMPTFPYMAVEQNTDWYSAELPPIGITVSPIRFDVNGFLGPEVAGNFSFGSITPPPRVDFESPFAFYNFIKTSRLPQLVVRSDNYGKHDVNTYLPGGGPQMAIRYSWKVGNSQDWEYSLQFGAGREFHETFRVGKTQVFSPTPAAYPAWVVHQKWPATTFVQAMQGYYGSEGIYFYTLQMPQPWPYLLGFQNQPPFYLKHPNLPETATLSAISDTGIPAGFRGEYVDNRIQVPRLYVSPVDHLVHLLYAQGGYDNLGGGWVVKEGNLNDGPYIDEWQLEQISVKSDPQKAGEQVPLGVIVGGVSPVTKKTAIYAADGFVMYSGNDSVVIRKASLKPMGTLSIPSDKASWQSYSQRVSPFVAGENPMHMLKWMAVLGNATGFAHTISHASILGVQVQNGGFSVLVRKGQAPYASRFLGLVLPQGPGDYILRYDQPADRWSTVPGSPVRIQVTVRTPATVVEDHPVSMDVSLRNVGTDFLTDGLLDVKVNNEVVANQAISLNSLGSWTGQIGWELEGSAPVAREPLTIWIGKSLVYRGFINVDEPSSLGTLGLFRLAANGQTNLVAGVAVQAVLVIAVGAGWQWTRLRRERRVKAR